MSSLSGCGCGQILRHFIHPGLNALHDPVAANHRLREVVHAGQDCIGDLLGCSHVPVPGTLGAEAFLPPEIDGCVRSIRLLAGRGVSPWFIRRVAILSASRSHVRQAKLGSRHISPSMATMTPRTEMYSRPSQLPKTANKTLDDNPSSVGCSALSGFDVVGSSGMVLGLRFGVCQLSVLCTAVALSVSFLGIGHWLQERDPVRLCLLP